MAADSSSHSHSGGIQLASIPMLEDQSNWEDWIRNAGGWLISHDYDEEAPVAPAPAARGRSANDAADPYTKMLATWKNGQKKAVTGLKSRCGKRAYGLVKTITDLSRLLETLEATSNQRAKAYSMRSTTVGKTSTLRNARMLMTIAPSLIRSVLNLLKSTPPAYFQGQY